LAATYFGHIGAYSGYGYNTPYYSYRPPQPVIIVPPPVVYDSRVAAPLIVRNPAPPVVFNNRVIQQALRENEQRWGNQIVVQPEIKLVKRPITPSSPQARQRSVNLQAKGDQWMRQQKYVHAYSRYKQALKQTPDLPVAHFRVGFALVATGRYSLAVAHFKRGLEIDPRWPSKGESLIEIYGVNNELAKMGFVRKAADWTREDVRDPERLFLMGLLLFFDNNPSQAAPFFETALRLRGSGEHLLAFLELGQGNQNNKKPPQAKKPAPQNVNPLNLPPPAPEPVPQTNE
jgi:tetratricopeptide (TPR) repeat protein